MVELVHNTNLMIKDSASTKVSCNFCGSKQTKLLYQVKGYSLVKCRQCSLVYVTPKPQPQTIQALYGKNICELYNHSSDLEDKKWEIMLRNICCYKKSGKLLEVGCATGTFLKKAATVFEVCGVELCPEAAAYARENYNLNVLAGDLQKQEFDNAVFDVVVASEVIEHLLDPYAFIREIARILKKDGLFVFTTGNIKSLIAFVRGKRWRYVDPPYHLYYFSPQSLRKYLTCLHFDFIRFSGHMGISIVDIIGLYSFYVDKRQFLKDIVARFQLGDFLVGSSICVYAHKS